MKRYAMSDIHGCLGAFAGRIMQLEKLGFFEEGCTDELVLLGDYIDRGPNSLSVIRLIMELDRRCPGRIVPLMGNHENDFLLWLGDGTADGGWNDDALLDDDVDALLEELLADFGPAGGHAAIDRLQMWQHSDQGGATMFSLLGKQSYGELESACSVMDDYAATAFEDACEKIRLEHEDAIRWVRGLREYYETEQQIFIHAGIDESCGRDWAIATPRDTILWDRSLRRGAFYKDVIAGHTATSTICGDAAFHNILWDGESHYYIDGMTIISGRIPVLVYDCETGEYFELDDNGASTEIKQF